MITYSFRIDKYNSIIVEDGELYSRVRLKDMMNDTGLDVVKLRNMSIKEENEAIDRVFSVIHERNTLVFYKRVEEYKNSRK